MKFQSLNKYSKGVKKECGYLRTDSIFKAELLQSKNYRKVRNKMRWNSSKDHLEDRQESLEEK